MTCTIGPVDRYRALVEAGSLERDPAQEAAVARLQQLHRRIDGYRPAVARFARSDWFGLRRRTMPAPPCGLYIHGAVGRGKSMLMDLFADGAGVERKRRTHFHEFMQDAHDLIHDWRQGNRRGGDTEPIRPTAAHLAERHWLLCFDEFEVRDIADAMIVARLFEAMFACGVVVVATSNRHPDDLYRHGLQRDRFLPFIEILKARMEIVHLDDGLDYRLDRLRNMAVYHVPSGPASEPALDQAFEALTDGRSGQPERIAYRGRDIIVPEACGPVARFAFADLCETPMGPGDFLAIARRYRSVIISGIPLLGVERRDAARRFITMIDTFYDNHVHVVLSADGPPQSLYDGNDWGFEFERTVSRLMEMQSVEYIETARRDTLST